jgi:PhzF family phenazine biosynthesis protein
MQAVAREMNLSETAFVAARPHSLTPQASSLWKFDLRWFTPAVEVDLCGHATLAAAHILWATGRVPPAGTAEFHTRSGRLTARRADDWIELDFPATPDTPADAPAGLLAALGCRAEYVGRSKFDYLVEVGSEEVVRQLSPDHARLRTLPARGVMVTSRAGAPGVDFVSRFFAPGSGIDEDPVTGSAHCCLTPFWSRRLGRTTLVAHQVSARGGVLRLALVGDRVLMRGQAVTVLRGELTA